MPYKDPVMRKAYEAQYREKNRERVRQKVRIHYHRHLEANRLRGREKYQSVKEQRRAYRLWTAYRITLAEYDALFEKQCGLCAICSRWYATLQVDHCHQSGAIRGLLCGACNKALGCFGDSPERIHRALEYLACSR